MAPIADMPKTKSSLPDPIYFYHSNPNYSPPAHLARTAAAQAPIVARVSLPSLRIVTGYQEVAAIARYIDDLAVGESFIITSPFVFSRNATLRHIRIAADESHATCYIVGNDHYFQVIRVS